MRAILLGLVIAAGPLPAAALICPPGDPPPRPEIRHWLSRKPYQPCVPANDAPEFPSGSSDSEALTVVCSYGPGECVDPPTRDRFLEGLQGSLGKPAGYKAGLTSRAAQARFAATGPVLGVLFDSMIMDDGATVDVAYGARPVWEADLLLVVGDDGINDARTREEALAHLRGFRPFIELPDLLYTPDTRISAAMLEAINVGARLGVAGEERPLPPDALTALAAMRVRAFDGSGALLTEGKGADALGHPLDVVLWVRDAVHREGGRLKAGDVISVGAFTPLTPPKAGQTIRVRYEGLAGDPEVSVRFR